MLKPAADLFVLFSTRIVRLFAYGALSVMLVLYLAAIGLSGPQIGLLLTLTLVGNNFVVQASRLPKMWRPKRYDALAVA